MFQAQALRGFINELTVASLQLPAQESKAMLIRVAMAERDRVIAEARARSGIIPSYRQIVDGVLDAPLSSVKPDGMIVFSWQYLREVVLEIVHALADRSPVDKGDYLRSIEILVDGTQVADGVDDTTHLQEIDITTKTVTIVPTVPYARRLEVGKRRDGSSFVVQVNPHIVEETAMTCRRLYGTLVAVEFNYVDISSPYMLVTPPAKSRRRKEPYAMRYPAIVLSPRVA